MSESLGNHVDNNVGDKQFITAWLLSLIVGFLGIDRFYLGKVGTGLLKLFTFGGLGVWYLVDLIQILTNAMTDKQGKKLQGYTRGNNKQVALFVTIGVVLLSVIFGGTTGARSGKEVINASNDASTQQDTQKTEADADAETPTTAEPAKTATPAASPASSETLSQKNAVSKAKSYLGFSSFSYEGLIAQLEFEKFSHEDAVYGADQSGANWNEQAAKKAKSYLDISSFSRQSLIDQLVFDKFTQEQAVYGVDAAGL